MAHTTIKIATRGGIVTGYLSTESTRVFIALCSATRAASPVLMARHRAARERQIGAELANAFALAEY